MKLIFLGLFSLCIFIASEKFVNAENDVNKSDQTLNPATTPEDKKLIEQDEGLNISNANEEDEQSAISENDLSERAEESRDGEIDSRSRGCRQCQNDLRAYRCKNSWLNMKNRKLKKMIWRLHQKLSRKTSHINALNLKMRRLVKQCVVKF